MLPRYLIFPGHVECGVLFCFNFCYINDYCAVNLQSIIYYYNFLCCVMLFFFGLLCVVVLALSFCHTLLFIYTHFIVMKNQTHGLGGWKQ